MLLSGIPYCILRFLAYLCLTFYLNQAFDNTPKPMKLFYHFLIFVFVSLVLLACANVFNSDGKMGDANNEPSTSENSQNIQPPNDSVAEAGKGGRSMLTSFKYNSLFDNGETAEKNCTCKKHRNPMNDLQMAILHFNQNQQQF